MSYTFSEGKYRARIKSSFDSINNSTKYAYSEYYPFEKETIEEGFFHGGLILVSNDHNNLMFPGWSTESSHFTNIEKMYIGGEYQIGYRGYFIDEGSSDIRERIEDDEKVTYNGTDFIPISYGVTRLGYEFDLRFPGYIRFFPFIKQVSIVPNTGIKISYPYYKISSYDGSVCKSLGCYGPTEFDYGYSADTTFVFADSIRDKIWDETEATLVINSSNSCIEPSIGYIDLDNGCGYFSLLVRSYTTDPITITINVIDTNNQIIASDSCIILMKDQTVLDFRPQHY